MRFDYPLLPGEFEIPDDWIEEAGIAQFKPARPCFRSAAETEVLLEEIEPPFRRREVPKSFRGLDRERFVRLLKGFVRDDLIESVPLLRLERVDYSTPTFAYRQLEGMHRFYGSIVAGFSHLPATVRSQIL